MNGRRRIILIIACILAAVTSALLIKVYFNRANIAAMRRATQSAVFNGSWREGKLLAQRWLQEDPESSDAKLLLAQTHSELGEWKQAVTLLAEVPKSDSRYVAVQIEKAEIEWSNLNDPFGGLQSCMNALAVEPRAIEPNARVISFYAMTFQRAAMLEAIRAAVSDRGEPREAYLYLVLADEPVFVNAIDMNGRWLSAEPEAEEFRCGLAVQMALHIFLDATATAKDDAYAKEEEAVRRLNEFADEFPGNLAILSVLLERAVQTGDLDAAADLLTRVPESSMNDHIIWTAKGWYEAARGFPEQAAASLETAIELHPMSPRAQHEYAAVLRQLGRLEEAEEFQQRSRRGTELRKQLLQLENAREADPEVLLKIRDYAQLSGDTSIVEALDFRLKQMRNDLVPEAGAE